MRNILLTLAFVGTAYCGWQVQPGKPTVQKAVQEAVQTLFACEVPVTGCSRTDAGVHALGFCAAIAVPQGAPEIPADRVPLALNRFLPQDIRIQAARDVDPDFHARYSVRRKEYVYIIDNSRPGDPFADGRAWHYPHRLDEAAMDEAARKMIGKNDFAAFMASGSGVGDTVREVFGASVRRDGDRVSFAVEADGFLYNMVRIMTGTLTAVSEGRIRAEDIPAIIASRDRSRAGQTAPPQGLYLRKVTY